MGTLEGLRTCLNSLCQSEGSEGSPDSLHISCFLPYHLLGTQFEVTSVSRRGPWRIQDSMECSINPYCVGLGGVSTCGASCNRAVGCKVISGGFLHLNLGLGFLI